MNRRDLILGASAVALTAVTAKAADHAGHDMAGHDMHSPGANKYAPLIRAAAICQSEGDLCIAHCVTAMKAGDITLAECLRTVTEMMALCAATSKLAALDS
ncbi:MAG: four-helix bundle copper-binding protein, partial [Nitrospinae bacterium]|nr:four-helix bundle copper-binding protein [Nitrospinota bacterium]